MKRIIFQLLFLTVLILPFASACNEDENNPPRQELPDAPENSDDSDSTSESNVLVAYFSRANYVPEGTDAVSGATNKAGNTQTVAMELAQLTGGILFEIVPERNYPVSHTECSEIALQEYEADARPALTTHVEDMEKYNTIISDSLFGDTVNRWLFVLFSKNMILRVRQSVRFVPVWR